MTTPANPIDKLSHLASIRTARTDQLWSATVALFSQLRKLVPVGTHVTVGNLTISLHRLNSNVGSDVAWSVCDGPTDDYGRVDCDDIERPVDFNGFLHGDFHCPVTGPSRKLLIAVGKAAPEIVNALVAKAEATNTSLDTALAGVTQAQAQVTP